MPNYAPNFQPPNYANNYADIIRWCLVSAQDTRTLRLGFFNVCSLRYKVDEVTALLRVQDFDIFGLAETWLDSTIGDGEVAIPGYSLTRTDRSGRRGGGTCIYYKSTLPIKPRPDLSVSGLELVWVDVQIHRQHHRVGCAYRPPDTSVEFWTDLESAMHSAGSSATSLAVLGISMWTCPLITTIISEPIYRACAARST